MSSGGGSPLGGSSFGGPAESAGLQAGDVITEIDGQRINSSTDLSTYINTKAPGDTIAMKVERNGATQDVQVALKNRPVKVP